MLGEGLEAEMEPQRHGLPHKRQAARFEVAELPSVDACVSSASVLRLCASGARPVEHPFGTLKARMVATCFLIMTPPRVGAEMALHVLA